LARLVQLTHLTLANNGLCDAAVVSLAEPLLSLTQLQKLVLSQTSVGSMGAAALSKALRRLQRLGLSRNSIGDVGTAAQPEALSTLAQLQVFDLFNKLIAGGGTAALSLALPALRHLWALAVSRNSSGDEGSAALALPPLTRLQSPNLFSDRISSGAKSAFRAAFRDSVVRI